MIIVFLRSEYKFIKLKAFSIVMGFREYLCMFFVPHFSGKKGVGFGSFSRLFGKDFEGGFVG